MAKKRKFYTVWRGNHTGVFDNWDDCRKAVDGFNGAIYKSFPTEESAWEAYEGNYADFLGKDKHQSSLSEEELKAIGRPVLDSISVDAACNSVTGEMEYQGVDTKSGARFFHMGPLQGGSNNIGEFLAIVHALAWCKKHNIVRPVYTDSHTAITWVRNRKARTKIQSTEKNRPVFDLIRRAEDWLQKNEWDNPLLKWETAAWGEIPADFGRK